MSIDMWVDPVDVLVRVEQDACGSWYWTVVSSKTSWPVDADTHVGSASTKTDALLDAMAYMSQQWPSTPVNLYSENTKFIEAVKSVHAWGHIEAHEADKARTHGLRKAAGDALASVMTPISAVVFAADGSFSISKRNGGWGWVCADGRFGQGSGPVASAVHAELNAINAALSAVSYHQRTVIRVDSKDAIDLVTNGCKPTTATRLRPIVNRIRANSAMEYATFEWTPGHAGDPLNEAANRLAIAARRNADALTSSETAFVTAQAIVDEHIDAYRHGLMVPATPKFRSRIG